MTVDNVGFNALSSLVDFNVALSPNNIRRIIISPEGVGVYYFVDKKPAFKTFPLINYMTSLSNPKVNMMLSALYKNRQITSIEEIIILLTASNGAEVLNPMEYDAKTIIGNRGSASIDGYKQSYKRLRYITKVYNINFGKFINALRTCKDFEFISDIPDLQGYVEKTEINSEDEYYKNNGISMKSAETYPAYDGKGGKLSKYFIDFKQKKENEKKSIEINKMKEESLKGSYIEFNKALKRYLYYFSCNNRMLNIEKKRGMNTFTNNVSYIEPVRAKLKECKGVSSKNTSYVLESCNSEKEALLHNIKELKECSQKIYYNIVKDLFTKVKDLAEVKPFTAKVLIDSCDCVVAPKGAELLQLSSDIASKLGKTFKGESMDDSIANACAYICTYFISNDDNSINSYCNKAKWMEVIRNGN